MSPRPSLIPDTENSVQSEPTTSTQQSSRAAETPKPIGRSGSCRICLKAFKPNEFSKTCVECDQKVCEDCASYSKLDECEFMETWRCSVCRRKMASRVFIPQESTDSVLEIPVLETLQRRHSDVKLGSTQCLGVDNGSALVPPRSPELRRHSDVSPASLKELEKLKAYDVYAPGVLASALQAASLKEPDAPGSRRPSFKMPVNDNSLEHEDMPSPDHIMQSALTVDEERRNKRRGSQLPDISALRNAQNAGNLPVYQIPALEDLEAPRRQTSLDGEAIKIVIHDVDSGPLCASKRRVVLQKDPADKAHRTRGFGMRVVGGKTGTDGRLFAYIVWTVPGGPAEKGGLQQGDKEQLAREKQVSGRVQIQVWYHGDRNELVVSLMAGDDLPPRDESLGYGGLPEAYASIKLMPKTYESLTFFNNHIIAYLLLDRRVHQ
ncbi:hypothetical protein RP20_CCG025709 [Aedes albopictus]|nr:hypothetical protein RP20_CCG025709 [Aedes albopictus]